MSRLGSKAGQGFFDIFRAAHCISGFALAEKVRKTARISEMLSAIVFLGVE